MAAQGLRSAPGQGNMVAKIGVKEGSSLMDMYATGSRLPDCSHACGPCFPCKRVMVSFKCSVAESCPIVYRCMCRGRYYHVPSN
ncbi:Protein EPIDERMAL PATTERNING FACTOR 2 [Acorus calamus]|uniref:Epidermal patterning factor-like protein n=1 Tax=Acorus calamus TaxID=4465 RepID=A0AAV9EQ56_ACOCL|nr:Protein EPIDERMAL PATTERNING FACTOR 2 [Acorus calamus]